MHQQASSDWFNANTSPSDNNALPNIRPQLRLSVGSPQGRVDRSRLHVGPEPGTRGSNKAAAEPYRPPLSGNQTGLNSSTQAPLDENCPRSPLGLYTQAGLYAQNAYSKGRILPQKSTNLDIGWGYVGVILWVGPIPMDTGETALPPHRDPPVSMVATPGAPNVKVIG